MARTTAQKKGDELEDAVHQIETVILRSNPITKEAIITIDTKKRVTVQGVRSEIDVYISVELGNDLELIYIFECKNREEPVSKDDITVFNDKIQEVGAQKGYFVAKKFGRDAINKAKRYLRIELLKATNEFETLPFVVAHFHYLNQIILHTNMSFKVKTDDPQKVGNVTFTDESKVRLKDEELLLGMLVERVRQNVLTEVMSHEPTGTFSAGAYIYDRPKMYIFDAKELFVDGYECLELNAQVSWEAHVVRPRIVSKFDIEKRGRV
ncbi:MAG TPA: restriction endonuclease, partial [Methylomirabilota bacterium]|nr:restriction endonuclease [Methylomirabilota bacterium]